MVVVRSKEKVLTVDQLLFIGDIPEGDWSKSNYEGEKK